MAFEDDLKQCVLARFPDAKFVEFGPADRRHTVAGKIGGVVTSSLFADMEQIDRQTELWQALRSRFSRDELSRRISLIMTFTDRELALLDED